MTPQGFAVIAGVLRTGSGLALGPDKLYLLESRLGPLLSRHGLPDLDALAQRLAAVGNTARALAADVIEAMTTNESLFFRDTKPFAHLREAALPALHAARPQGVPLRIWSAAASTGQEPYSLAMLVADARPALGARPVDILGTDIAQQPLARAREGRYTQFEVQRGLPVQSLLKHFRKSGPDWQIAEPLRDAVEFRPWNLLDDPRPLGRFDVIFCRNVLIYFDPPTKARVLEALARQLAPDGYLYLGASETAVGLSETLAALPGVPSAYRKRVPVPLGA